MVKINSLRQQTISGVIWNFFEVFLRKGVTGLSTLLLSWFLAPEDFGLIAMMTVFLAFSQVLVDGGFKQSLIRKLEVTQNEYSTAFYANLFSAFLVYSALCISAPYIADFYEQPRLIALIRVSGAAVIFNALSVVQEAVLTRQLKFKLQLYVSLPAALVSAVIAMLLAYSGFGVWALIAQILIAAVLTALLYWRLNLWWPTWEFSWHAFASLFRFGGYLLLAQVTNVPYTHMYVIVIAKVFSAGTAGLYFFSERIKDLIINQLVNSIQTVTYPVLSRLQNEDSRLKNGYREVISVSTFILFPSLLFIAALAEPLFILIMPDRWHEAVIYLQLMCISALLFPLHSINLNILKVKDRSDLVFYLGLIKKALAIVIFIYSYRFGVVGILIGQLVHSIISYIPNCFYSNKLISYKLSEQLKDFLPALMASGLISVLIFAAVKTLEWTSWLKVLVLGPVGVFAYIMLAQLVGMNAFLRTKHLIFKK